MIFKQEFLDIINYAYDQAHDNLICVCPSAVPDWDDNNITDDMIDRQLFALNLLRRYVEQQPAFGFNTTIINNL